MKVVTCLSVFLLSMGSIMYAQNWELRKNKDGIKIYSKFHKEKQASEFKAEIVLDVSTETLIEILKATEHYKEWMSDLKYAKKLKIVNENMWYAYYLAEVPWPLEDRDIIYLLNLKEESGRATLSLSSKADFIPESKEYVRMKAASGKWVLTKKGENKTHVLYQMYAEPEINVPAWIMNMFIVEGPYKTLMNLRTYASNREVKRN